MADQLGVALLGYGLAGRSFHAPLIGATPGLVLRHVVSRQRERIASEHPEVRISEDVATALADPEIDAVVIATPNDQHAAQAIAALDAGKHVLVDKPFALDTAQARRVLDHAHARGLTVTAFHNRRHDGEFLTLRRLLAEDVLGEVAEFHSHFDRHRPLVRDRWREQATPGAGLWFDLGPHLLDQALVLFGMPHAISVDLLAQREGALGDDYFHATLHYPRMRAHLHAGSLVPAHGLRLAVHGRRASYLKHGLDVQEDQLRAGMAPGAAGWGEDPRTGTLTRIGEDGKPVSTPIPTLPGDYRATYAAFAAAARGDGVPDVSGEQLLQVMQLLETGARSAASGQRIVLD